MSTSPKPHVTVAVVMRRLAVVGPVSRWQSYRWVLDEVLLQEESFGDAPRLLFREGDEERWLHGGYDVALFKDDAEGYYLNVSTPAPCWFVLWRMEEAASVSDAPMAVPVMVSLSYHDAGRWLDAQETVEQVPAPQDVVDWLRAFVDQHHVQEPRKRRRPESFRSLTDRFGQPVRVTTDKLKGGAHE